MKTAFFITIFFMTMTAFTLTEKTWKSDVPHSQLIFTVEHLGVAEVSGTFNDFQATIITNRSDLSDARVEMTAKIASIDTRVAQRDTHLKSADFLDAEKFPEINFLSTGIKPAGKNRYKLTGKLTLHGITRAVTLDLFYRGTVENPMTKKQTAGFQVIGNISRKAFDIGSKFPAPLISDAIAIKAAGEFLAD